MRYLFLIFILFGCKSIKTQSEKSIQKDSIFVFKTIEKFTEVKDTILIDNPCDSNGILLPFRERIKAGQGEVSISSNKGKIKAIVHYYPFVNSDNYRVEYKYITKTIYKEVEKKNPFNFLGFISMIIILILILWFAFKF